MSTSELYSDLDPKIAGPLAKVTEALKAEISSQIDAIRKDVQALVSGGAQGARSFTASTSGELDPLEELKLAAAGIDRSTKQAAILTGLLEGAGRFSSRAAFVLVRDDGETCWGSLGFEDAGRSMEGEPVITPNGDSPWAQARDGAGTLALTADECATFCSQFDASTPVVGALLPLSLGDHVAGYLYADRVGDGHLNITALQLLTFVAGQTLETLPVRKRSFTPTLKVAAASTAPVAVPAPVSAEPQAQPQAQPDTQPEAAAPEPVVEPEPATVAPEAILADAELLSEPATEAYEAATVEAEDDEPTAFATAAEVVPSPVEAEPTFDEALTVDEAPEVEAWPIEPEQETATLPSLPAFAAGEPAHDMAGLSAAEPEPAPAPEPPPPAAPPLADTASTQVMPPDDVRGPGWAFTTMEVATDAGSEALHEEARRLARLLVTEIKLYNEEQVEQGRRGGDIYRRLRDDIDRSRQIFEDRIDPQIRAENDYFKEALVRILAGGDESLLGI